MGVTTGITLEFQFGTNWAYYSHYVGDIFGTPLAVEGLMAFFLESHIGGPLLLRLGQALPRSAPAGDHAGGARLQPLRPLDPHRQRLDAKPGRRRVQPHDHAHGLVDVAAVIFNPVAPGQVRPHGGGGLCGGLPVRDEGWAAGICCAAWRCASP